MKNNIDTYKIWASDGALWTQWAKPVLFMLSSYSNYDNWVIPNIGWITEADGSAMIIADLPGASGVTESLALARIGFRPVPVYNGVDGPNNCQVIVPVGDIVAALFENAEALRSCCLRNNAPPVFMLDSNRMNGHGKQCGTYDNRWCVFPQDMPSSSFLINAGIKRVIVRSDRIRNDLSHILRRYYESGIKIYLCDGETLPENETTVRVPSKYKSLSYRFKVIAGLIRNASGGFGGMIPEPMESNSGGRYYGLG